MSDSEFWDEIWSPRVVAVPPRYAVRDMCVCADGEIRHYGQQMVHGELREVYIGSHDEGLSWKTYLKAADDPGAMVKCPWAGYWLSLTRGQEVWALKSSRGPGFPAEERFRLPIERMEPRLPIPLVSRRRWISPISDTRCDGTCYHAGAAYSDDDGCSWTYVAVPWVPEVPRRFACDARPHWFNNGCEPTIVELSDGALLMALRTSGEYVAFSTSQDGGASWSVPQMHSGFWQANTMPTLLKLRDGRIVFFWNNTAMLPTRNPAETPELFDSELDGTWEAVFTNRDALHAAISEDDGKTWRGFREIALNAIRNDADYREAGKDAAQENDKSVHQSQAIELANGKILLAYGQHSAARRIMIFDPGWLYETSRRETFERGLENISHHLYVKSLSGGSRGWSGHCSWNRMPGVVMAREPETARKTVREAAWLCRIPDPRLVSTRSGVVWNFPAAPAGHLEIDCRIDGDGFQIALQDHWSNPSDEYLAPRSFAVIAVTAEDVGGAGKWVTLRLDWTCDDAAATLSCDGCPERVVAMAMADKSAAGPSYLHLQTLASEADLRGTYFRELRFESRAFGVSENVCLNP